MRKFTIRVTIFCIPVILLLIIIFYNYDGTTDPYYLKFTSSKQSNLILGTSRAAQGIQPKVLEHYIDGEILNYGFTSAHSPYGKTYLNSVKRKLKKNTTDGVFILTVEPWSLTSRLDNPEDSLNFIEKRLCLGNTKQVNINPNPFYILNNLDKKNLMELINPSLEMVLHTNGWLEMNVDMDKNSVQKRLEKSIIDFEEKYAITYKFSNTRFHYLKKTIHYLNNHGKVYLIRLPIHPKIMEIENQLIHDFENKIGTLIGECEGYLNLTHLNEKVNYTDGHHLHKDSGKEISKMIGEWIHQLKKEK